MPTTGFSNLSVIEGNNLTAHVDIDSGYLGIIYECYIIKEKADDHVKIGNEILTTVPTKMSNIYTLCVYSLIQGINYSQPLVQVISESRHNILSSIPSTSA